MYAVFASGGKQHRAAVGDVVRLQKMEGDAGTSVTFDEVLLIGNGDDVSIGAPALSGAKVEATIRAQGRADKILVVKFRRRKHHRKQQGHRQHYTEVEIVGISA